MPKPLALAWTGGLAYRPLAAARWPLDDRGLFYGDSIFETVRVEDGVPIFAGAHARRLLGSAKALGMPAAQARALWRAALAALPKVAGVCSLRVAVTRGEVGALAPAKNARLRGFAVLRRIVGARETLSVCFGDARKQRDALCHAKHGNYLHALLALAAARARGFDEAIVCNDAGRPIELCTANFFARIKGEWITPPLDEGVLPGVTRAAVLRAARHIGLAMSERPLSVREVRGAGALFATSSLREIAPIIALGGRRLVVPRELDALAAAYRREALRDMRAWRAKA